MLLRKKQLPLSAFIPGLKYWWPFDDVTSGFSVAKEQIQNATASPPSGQAYGGIPVIGRWPISGDKIRSPRMLQNANQSYSATVSFPVPQFTVCFWTQTPGTPPANNYGWWINANNAGYRIQIGDRGGYVCIAGTGAQLDLDTAAVAGPAADVPIHIALDYDGSNYHLTENTVRLLTTAGTGAPAGTGASGTMFFGGGAAGFDLNFLYDVRIYNRALSTAELRIIFTEGFIPPPIDLERMAMGVGGVVSGPAFRRTLSSVGTRTGSRQRIMG